jgi:hypothetical protein
MQNNTDLSRFLEQLNIKDSLSIEEDLGDGYVRLKISEAERRQAFQDINCVEDVFLELLRNSRDAGSKNIFIGTKKIKDKTRVINFVDDGNGIPENLKNLIFEARVTSKLENGIKDSYGFHGRGMALFSIKLNVREVILTFSGKSRGASFFLDIDLDDLPEKKDQSLIPEIIKTDDDASIIGGVNNIIKTIIEFQVQYRDINFYYGSPIQILATMREYLKRKNPDVDYPKFNEWEELDDFISEKNIKVTEIPSLTDNYNLMEEIAEKIFHMDISKRGIQRIIYNEIKPLNPLKLELLKHTVIDGHTTEDNNNGFKEINKKELKLRLFDEARLASRFKDEEIKVIIDLLKDEFNRLGEKYFLNVNEDIKFSRNNNIIKIIIELIDREDN